MTGGRVLATLIVIFLATTVAPPTAAWAVNRHRLGRAAADVAAIAERLRVAEGGPRNGVPLGGVLLGPGRMPATDTPAANRWGMAPRGSLAAAVGANVPVPIDPWGNCYISNVEAGAVGSPTTVWVLSAGPNGVVDTPFLSSAPNPAGDDVAVRIR